MTKLGPGMIVETMDPRIPIIAQMATVIYVEKLVYCSDKKLCQRNAIDEAFTLYGQIAIRLAENDR